jgi:Zn-dependent protease with chaperone function
LDRELENMDDQALVAVVAHELAHIILDDIMYPAGSSDASIGFLLLSLAGNSQQLRRFMRREVNP